jgi:hypothetical protein
MPPRIAVVICYRPQPECDRPAQLEALLARLVQLAAEPLLVVVAQQTVDGRRFNRGALLNAGALLARERYGVEAIVFHDADMLPTEQQYQYYNDPGRCAAGPVHVAAQYARWAGPRYFGGIVAMSWPHIVRTNGFPCRFWGWGGEDQALRSRCLRAGLRIRAAAGAIEDTETDDQGRPLSAETKLRVLRESGAKCPDKREQLSLENLLWSRDGIGGSSGGAAVLSASVAARSKLLIVSAMIRLSG